MGGIFGGGSTELPEPEPVTEQKTKIDPDRNEQLAEAARRRKEILQRRGRAQMTTGETTEGPTRSGVSVTS
jgi:hypothetical protein